MNVFDLVVFDLDGTLIDSAPDLHGALNAVLTADGRRPLTLVEVESIVGDGAAMLVRIGGYSLTDVVGRRVRFSRARSAGWTELSGGLLTDHPRGEDLPGPMAPMVPLSTDDGRGGSQGMLWDRRTGRLTVVIRVSPIGLDLADRGQADAWVAAFWPTWATSRWSATSRSPWTPRRPAAPPCATMSPVGSTRPRRRRPGR